MHLVRRSGADGKSTRASGGAGAVRLPTARTPARRTSYAARRASRDKSIKPARAAIVSNVSRHFYVAGARRIAGATARLRHPDRADGTAFAASRCEAEALTEFTRGHAHG